MSLRRPHVVAHVAVALDGATRGFAPDLGAFYGVLGTWDEDVTLAGSETILAQERALSDAPPGPGANPRGPLLAVVDSGYRVAAWEALRRAGHWRDAVALRGPGPGRRVDLPAALEQLHLDGARTVRVDSGGRLIGVLAAQGLLDELSLLSHPCVGAGPSWNDDQPVRGSLRLVHHEQLGEDLLWSRYAIDAT